MIGRGLLRTVAALSLGLGCLHSYAAEPGTPVSAPGILKRVDEHYNHLSSLKCSFTERFSGIGVDRTESGTLLLRKPGRMRWSYNEPAGKLFVLDGKFAWSYTPGDAQVQRVAARQLDDLRSPLRFLLGHTQLGHELAGLTVSPLKTGFQISGVPKGLEQRITQLSLEVSVNGRIDAIRLAERSGAVTEFHFAQMVENVAIPADAFHFAVPSGVPVVDAMPPI